MFVPRCLCQAKRSNPSPLTVYCFLLHECMAVDLQLVYMRVPMSPIHTTTTMSVRGDDTDRILCVLDSMDGLNSGPALVARLQTSKFLAIKNGDMGTIARACECSTYRSGTYGLKKFGYEEPIYMGVVKITNEAPYLFIGPRGENGWSILQSDLETLLFIKLRERSGNVHLPMVESEPLLHDTGLFNDEGHAICQGEEGWQNYYCGLKRPHIKIRFTDGMCGPTNGNNCPSCKRFTQAEGIYSDDCDDGGCSDDSDEPRISWTEGGPGSPIVRITHHGHPVEHEIIHPGINSKRKYPHLYEDSRAFPELRGKPWQDGRGGHFLIETVHTKFLHDVDVDVFSEACRIMTDDIRGIPADRCLAEYKGMVRHYFKSNTGNDEFNGLLPGGRPDCVKLITRDWEQRKCMQLAFEVRRSVMLVTIEFDRLISDGANMCDGPNGINKLFSLLYRGGVFSEPISESVMR
jgi:hypothetical protein